MRHRSLVPLVPLLLLAGCAAAPEAPEVAPVPDELRRAAVDAKAALWQLAAIRQAARMRHEVQERDRLPVLRELGEDLSHRPTQLQFALVDEDHQPECGHRLRRRMAAQR